MKHHRLYFIGYDEYGRGRFSVPDSNDKYILEHYELNSMTKLRQSVYQGYVGPVEEDLT
jgi:hypothetical protein